MRKYAEYKDSGIAWIGEIPKDWTVIPFGKIAKIITGNTPSKNTNKNYFSDDDGLLWIKPDNLAGFTPIDETKEYLNTEGELLSRQVPANTPLVCCIGTIGKFGYSGRRAAYNQQINAIVLDENRIFWKFGLYVISSQEEQHWFYSNGNVVQILNTENQKRIKLALPDVSSQKIIVNYLDKKTSTVNSLIADKLKLIELLKEKRQAIISEAVTKGLDSTVPMKDSGIEWIGEIPAHWEVIPLKTFSYMKGRIGWQGLKADEFIDEGAYLVTGTDFEDGKVCWERSYRISDKRYEEAPQIQLNVGDLLITKDGTIGKLAYLDFLPDRASLNSHLLVIRPLNNKFYNKYLYWVFSSASFKHYTDIVQDGSIMPSLSQEKIGNFRFAIPPINEQKEIMDYVQSKVSSFDLTLNDIFIQIEKLKEYRQSIISEAVTGKIMIEDTLAGGQS